MIFEKKNYGLTKKAEDLHKEMDKLMNYYAKKMVDMDTVSYMEPEDILMFKDVAKMYDLSKELMEDYAKKVEEMDRKLDLILKKLEK